MQRARLAHEQEAAAVEESLRVQAEAERARYEEEGAGGLAALEEEALRRALGWQHLEG